jgi:hypothetical protein
MGKHNKKRNVGLIHEQLVRRASELTVEGRTQEANGIIDVMVRHFGQDSELLKEYKLFGALLHARAQDRETARRIIEESKRLSAKHDPRRLDAEKSKLIGSINRAVRQEGFYDQPVQNYKLFATVQTLLNEWRGANRLDAAQRVAYERALEDHLLREDAVEPLVKKENADPLVLNLMIKKFNAKYGEQLNTDQKAILECKLAGRDELLVATMREIRSRAKQNLQTFFEGCSNSVLASKRDDIMRTVEQFEPLNDNDSIGKAMVLANLLQEIGQ